MFRSFAIARPGFAAWVRRATFLLAVGLSVFGLAGVAYAAPVISSISPMAGTVDGGTIVTLSGSGFVAGPTVTFGGYDASPVTFVDDATLTVVASVGYPTTVQVVVTAPDGESSNAYSGYTWELPALTSISPVQGTVDGGTTVTVNGSYTQHG